MPLTASMIASATKGDGLEPASEAASTASPGTTGITGSSTVGVVSTLPAPDPLPVSDPEPLPLPDPEPEPVPDPEPVPLPEAEPDPDPEEELDPVLAPLLEEGTEVLGANEPPEGVSDVLPPEGLSEDTKSLQSRGVPPK